MKKLLVVLTLLAAGTCVAEGMIVTDGFESQFVPRSPDNPDETDCRRLFDVYLPEQFLANPQMTFPIVYFLVGLGGNYTSFDTQNKIVLDRMIAQHEVVPMIVIAVDPRVITYDGSFYVDSILNGFFERYIVEELIPYVDQKYRQKTTQSGDAAPFRAITGHSMGGYGTLYYGVKHPELFSSWGGLSPTGFWTTTTNLASPPTLEQPNGNPMYTLNKLLLGELNRNTFTQLSPGDYMATVLESGGSQASLNATLIHIEDQNDKSLRLSRVTSRRQQEDDTIDISIAIAGGQAPYSYTITSVNSGQSRQMISEDQSVTFAGLTHDFLGVDPASIDINIFDSLGVAFTATLGGALQGVFDFLTFTLTHPTDTNGSITINQTGGLAPFSYFINGMPGTGVLMPQNGDITFGFYAWAAAFSPINEGQEDPCSVIPPPCLQEPPYCVDYPFETTIVGDELRPTIVQTSAGPSFVPVFPILALWQTFDPFFLLDTTDPAVLKRQNIYFDSGADLLLEPVDNVSSRYFSDKLTSFDVNHEYFLFNGGHTTFLSLPQIEFYRFTTTFKFFSGAFAAAGVYVPDVITTIVGTQTIELADSSVMSIADKALVGIETDDTISTTAVTIRILDQARFEIGTKEVIGGALQVGNRFGKANLLFDPSRVNDTINFTLEVNGPQATFFVGKQGVLGFGLGVTGNQTDVPNFFGISTLTNVNNIVINLNQGRFDHSQIASSLDENGSLLAIGAANGYTLTINDDAVLAGGANMATITEGNLIHPTVQDTAGVIDPGGVRPQLVVIPNPDSAFDDFYGPPKGLYASQTFSRNDMMVNVLSSSEMLKDTNKQPINPHATQQEFFEYLQVAPYAAQGRKRAPITELDNECLIDFLTSNENAGDTINRPVVGPVSPCSPLSSTLQTSSGKDKVINDGAVGVKVANVNGVPTVIRVYDLDPEL